VPLLPVLDLALLLMLLSLILAQHLKMAASYDVSKEVLCDA